MKIHGMLLDVLKGKLTSDKHFKTFLKQLLGECDAPLLRLVHKISQVESVKLCSHGLLGVTVDC